MVSLEFFVVFSERYVTPLIDKQLFYNFEQICM